MQSHGSRRSSKRSATTRSAESLRQQLENHRQTVQHLPAPHQAAFKLEIERIERLLAEMSQQGESTDAP